MPIPDLSFQKILGPRFRMEENGREWKQSRQLGPFGGPMFDNPPWPGLLQHLLSFLAAFAPCQRFETVEGCEYLFLQNDRSSRYDARYKSTGNKYRFCSGGWRKALETLRRFRRQLWGGWGGRVICRLLGVKIGVGNVQKNTVNYSKNCSLGRITRSQVAASRNMPQDRPTQSQDGPT